MSFLTSRPLAPDKYPRLAPASLVLLVHLGLIFGLIYTTVDLEPLPETLPKEAVIFYLFLT